MTSSRWWLMGLLAGALLVSPIRSLAAGPEDLSKRVPTLVRALAAESQDSRDDALVELVSAGASAVEPLANAASTVKDPETAWRSAEALDLICRTVDDANAVKVRAELTRISRSTDAAQAGVCKETLKRWDSLRHEYAAGQLEARGAKIADVPFAANQAVRAVPAVPAAKPALRRLLDFGEILRKFIPAPAPPAVAGAVEGVMEFEALDVFDAAGVALAVPLPDGAEEAVAPPADSVPPRPALAVIHDALAALGRAAQKVSGFDRHVQFALGAVERKLAPMRPAPVAAEAKMVAAPVFFPGGGFFGPGMVAATPVVEGAKWIYAEQEFAVGEAGQLTPGMLRIDSEWRGGDDDLRFVAQLQNIHTVSIRDADLSDRALVHLAKLRSLTRLEVTGTRMTGAGLVKLRQQRPQLTIIARGTAVLGVAGIDHIQGMHVREVIGETGARRAGVMEEDIITKIGSTPIRNFSDLVLALYDQSEGQRVKIEYLRGGKLQSCDITLTSRETAPPGADARMVLHQPQPIYPYNVWRGGFGGGMMMPGMPMMMEDFAAPVIFDR